MEKRPPAMFVADAAGLDFLNSIATPIETPVDWLRDGEGLLDWLRQAASRPSRRWRRSAPAPCPASWT